jgi:hypothetical protein
VELQTNVKSGEVKITEVGTTETKPVTVTTEKKPEPDLITRVSQFKKEEVKETTASETKDTFGLTQEDFEKVNTDPVLSKFYKSMQADYTRKTQAAATDKKEAERLKAEFSTWTPERIQQLLNDQGFVNAAQTVMKSQAPVNFEGTQDDWSTLSDTDKAKFQGLEREVNSLKQQNYQVRKMQEDETLKNKYSNYSPQAIDILTADLLQGKVQATREHLFKVFDYDEAVERAYHLGLQDGKGGIKEKVSSSAMEGTMAVSSKEPLKKEEDETDRNYFKRLFLNNVAKQNETTIKK